MCRIFRFIDSESEQKNYFVVMCSITYDRHNHHVVPSQVKVVRLVELWKYQSIIWSAAIT